MQMDSFVNPFLQKKERVFFNALLGKPIYIIFAGPSPFTMGEYFLPPPE